ncbi:hypothetical protein CSW23_01250 [Thermus scotoductus]|uniref:Uncharacterized protein n=2 Tax=Thermus scotoductus TaxID=37636 RepID=A0A430V6T4_THESC|nr:hypothetical protein [Thermus scotoductus]RTI02523.1 hypothetical protein CSW31_01490 [Thermus scotoductus]RTI20608.1 hypothetical protein CSW23_01250 [Thermus scotoductus]
MSALKEFVAALTLTFMRDRVRRAQHAQTQEERERLEGEAIQAFLDTIKLFELEREEVFRYFPFTYLDTFPPEFLRRLSMALETHSPGKEPLG